MIACLINYKAHNLKSGAVSRRAHMSVMLLFSKWGQGSVSPFQENTVLYCSVLQTLLAVWLHKEAHCRIRFPCVSVHIQATNNI